MIVSCPCSRNPRLRVLKLVVAATGTPNKYLVYLHVPPCGEANSTLDFEELKVPRIIQHQTIVDAALECADTVKEKLQSPRLHFIQEAFGTRIWPTRFCP